MDVVFCMLLMKRENITGRDETFVSCCPDKAIQQWYRLIKVKCLAHDQQSPNPCDTQTKIIVAFRVSVNETHIYSNGEYQCVFLCSFSGQAYGLKCHDMW
jgi:hypothetical protein